MKKYKTRYLTHSSIGLLLAFGIQTPVLASLEQANHVPVSKPVKSLNHPEAEKKAIRDVIIKMNQAVTDSNLEEVLITFAKNAIKVDLFPAHYPKQGKNNKSDEKLDLPDVYPKTADLKQRWQAVFGIMSASTKLYERKTETIKVQVDGAMATAWVKIRTRSVPHDPKRSETINNFYEMLVLKKMHGQWKIMLTSNNRHDR